MTLGGDARLVETVHIADDRGVFAKPFMWDEATGSRFEVRELFWSRSSRGTVRGMHFQERPRPAGKIVWVSAGRVVDVLVDLRAGDAYGAVTSFQLDATTGAALWVPEGYAHGFQALEDGTIVNYAVDDVWIPRYDLGVRWDSIGFAWPLPPSEISPRDLAHPALADYTSTFG